MLKKGTNQKIYTGRLIFRWNITMVNNMQPNKTERQAKDILRGMSSRQQQLTDEYSTLSGTWRYTHQPLIRFACSTAHYGSGWCWCNSVREYFYPLCTNGTSLKGSSFLEHWCRHVRGQKCSPTVDQLLMATSSRIMHHVTELISSQTGFQNVTMTSLYSSGLHNQHF